MDLNAWCVKHAYAGYAKLYVNNAYGWDCDSGPAAFPSGINVNQACQDQYGGGSSAYFDSFWTPTPGSVVEPKPWQPGLYPGRLNLHRPSGPSRASSPPRLRSANMRSS